MLTVGLEWVQELVPCPLLEEATMGEVLLRRRFQRRGTTFNQENALGACMVFDQNRFSTSPNWEGQSQVPDETNKSVWEI